MKSIVYKNMTLLQKIIYLSTKNVLFYGVHQFMTNILRL